MAGAFYMTLLALFFNFKALKAEENYYKGKYSDRLRDEVFSCPMACQCPSYERVDCSRAGLTHFPKDLSSRALYVFLEENNVSEIGQGCFLDCPNIETLNLRANNLSEYSISTGVLLGLTKLRHLYLSDNVLQKIPMLLPSSIISLSLEGNLISGIDGNTLSPLTKLKNLYLHDNRITNANLSRHAFQKLERLTELTLTNNMLSTVPKLPNSVEWLHMVSNLISYIPNGIFRRKHSLMALIMRGNVLGDDGVSEKAFVGLKRLEYLDLSMNKLQSVPLKLPRSLTRLHLEKNQLIYIPDGSLSPLKKLEYLLLHNNRLNSSSFPRGTFFPLRNLRTLHIYKNEMDSLPHLLPPRLEILMVMSNNISFLRKETFRKAKFIKELGLQYNNLTNKGLERGALRSLRQLEVIDVSGNKLTALPTLPRSVEVVILSNNKIVRIPPNSVTRLTRIRELSLDGNMIQFIGDEIFRNSTSLKKLELSYNSLRKLPRFLPPNLEYLGLTKNQLFEIRYQDFFSAPLLKDILLNENDLIPENVDERAFRALRFVRRVDITWRWPG